VAAVTQPLLEELSHVNRIVADARVCHNGVMKRSLWFSCCALLALYVGSVTRAADGPQLTPLEAKHLAGLRQVTFGFPRAGEGYFSPDGQWIVFQAYPPGYPFYQIYVQRLDEREARRISTGRGRTTCAYFSRDGKTLIFASSHTDPKISETEEKAREEAKRGGRRSYQWDFDANMEIYECNFDGSDLKRLTNSPGYDAEGSFSFDGKQIVFTSKRAGNPNIYVMDADGSHVRQVTHATGYNGGPFFSPDDRWIIFRSDRQKKDMLQLYAIAVDGTHEVQLTNNLDTVNWAPFFHPSEKYLIWCRADYAPGRRPGSFDLFTMEIEHDATHFRGGAVTQITDAKGADILPVFSPDGTKLMWTSTRTPDGTSQLWIAHWLRGRQTTAQNGR
jgi:Tol biopolymer transport system component